MFEAAMNYLQEGKSVIPVGLDKRPLISWKEFQTRLPDPTEVTTWFAQYPTANVGIITGKISDLIVVDVDERNGGMESLKGKYMGLTKTIKTPNGIHYYYQYESGIPKSTPLPGIDVQSDGAYVLAPPSQRNNQKYYVKQDIQSLIQLPNWLKQILRNHKVMDTRPGGWKQYLQGVSQGNRDSAAAKIAGGIIKETNNSLIALLTLKEWNHLNTPPLAIEQLEKVVNSIWRKHQSNFQGIAVESASHLMASAPPKVEWLIDTVWPAGVGFIAGEPEQGKTWLTLDMAMSIVSGAPFLGEYTPKITGPILFVEEEQSIQELHQRLDLLMRGKKLTREQVQDFYCLVQKGVKFPEYVSRIIDFIKFKKCKAMFIDSFRRLHAKDEVSSTDLQPILEAISKIRRVTGCSVILIHHLSKSYVGASKNPLTRLRGSGDLLAWADTVMGLSPTDHGSHKLIFKMRGAPKPDNIEIIRTFDPIANTVILRKESI